MLIASKGNFVSLSPKLEQTLKAIYDGTQANGIHYANPNSPMVAVLVNGGHAVTDSNRIDPNDGRKIAVTVTDAGHIALGTQPVAVAVTQTQEATMEAATATATDAVAAVAAVATVRRTRTTVVPEVMLSTGHMVLPTSSARRGGNRKEVYAFGQLQAPQPDGMAHSFFVPATEANPTPADTLRAAVSSANARYKEKGGAQFKHFVVDVDAEFGVAGVRVFRVK